MGSSGDTNPDAADGDRAPLPPDPHRETREPGRPAVDEAFGMLVEHFPESLRTKLSDLHETVTRRQRGLLSHATWQDRRSPYDGTAVALKVFRLAQTDQDEIWDFWSKASEDYVAPLIDHGKFSTEDGPPTHGYEVTPFCTYGSLDDFVKRQQTKRLSVDQVDVILTQLVATLKHIHVEVPNLGRRTDKNWVHCDIKPANILVRSERPLRLWLTDFGIARVQSDGADIRSAGISVEYAAPEASYSAPYQIDYWSLGITLLELLRGSNPFFRNGRWLGESEILTEINNGVVPIEVADELPANWDTLLGGLLSKNKTTRWTSDHVRAWRAGRPPPVNRSTSTSGAVRPFEFDGVEIRDLRTLAEEMGRRWTAAATLAIGADWKRLLSWSKNVNADKHRALVEVWANFINLRQHADRITAAMIVSLDQSISPVFRGRRVDEQGLVDLATRARRGEREALTVVEALRESGSLRTFSRLDRQQALEQIDNRWRELHRIASTSVSAHLGSLEKLPQHEQLAPMLLLVAAKPETAERLREKAEATRTRDTRFVGWFEAIARDAATGDQAPAFHALMILAAELARAQGRGLDDGQSAPLTDAVQPPPGMPASNPRTLMQTAFTTLRLRRPKNWREPRRAVPRDHMRANMLVERLRKSPLERVRSKMWGLALSGYAVIAGITGVATAKTAIPLIGTSGAIVLGALVSGALLMRIATINFGTADVLVGAWYGTFEGAAVTIVAGLLVGGKMRLDIGQLVFWAIVLLIVSRAAIRGAAR